jgi:hypothetical protein
MSKSAVMSRGAGEDVLIVAVGRGFMCVECSLCKHAGSSLLCTRVAEMREHLCEHRARGHRGEAIEKLRCASHCAVGK